MQYIDDLRKLSRIEEYLEKELRIVNKHLPYRRIPLSELLKQEFPYIVLRDGTLHYFKRRELEYLASITSRDEWSKLYLPIIIEIRPELGKGAGVIRGEIEVKVASKILNIKVEEKAKQLIIYRPQIMLLRQLLPTTTQYAFYIST